MKHELAAVPVFLDGGGGGQFQSRG
jgi:hypothetical protein